VPVRRIQAESEEDGGVEGTEPGPQEQLGGPLAGMKREKYQTMMPNTRDIKMCLLYILQEMEPLSAGVGMIIPCFR
jgi:hypothetical protein